MKFFDRFIVSFLIGSGVMSLWILVYLVTTLILLPGPWIIVHL